MDETERREAAESVARRVSRCEDPANCYGDCAGCERDKSDKAAAATRGCAKMAFNLGCAFAIFAAMVTGALIGCIHLFRWAT